MKKYENFCKALNNLEKIQDYQPPYSPVVLTGIVGLFEVCFEQARKAMKEILENEGLTGGKIGSPRQILKMAYSAHMIENDLVWLDMLEARNNAAHAYNEEIALSIAQAVKTVYLPQLRVLKRELEENWIE